MKIRSVLVSAVAVAALAAGGYWLVEKRRAETAAAERLAANAPVAVPSVTVSRVASADFVETTEVSGSLVPREEILVSPEIEGLRVLELLVDEGDRVTMGQVLARLVAEQIDAQLAQNDANLARATAAIAQAKSQIAQAEAQAKEAGAQLERAEPLKKSGYLSGSTYDQREAAAHTADAAVVAAKDGLKAAEAERAQVEAQRRELDWRRGNTEVTSPANGIISKRNARIGAMASGAGQPMFRIIQNGEIELDAEIVETDLPAVKIGQRAVIDIAGTTDVSGTVRLVSPEVDRTTRLGRVRIFIGANPSLFVGAFASARIETAKGHGLGIPTSAVTFDSAGPYVQVVNGEAIEKRPIKTGLMAGNLIEAKEGLREGEQVVTRAGTFLRDGDKVRPVLPNAALSEAK